LVLVCWRLKFRLILWYALFFIPSGVSWHKTIIIRTRYPEAYANVFETTESFCFGHTRRCLPIQTPCQSRYLGRVSLDMCSNVYIFVPLLITFFSAHHSPRTVKRKAREFVIGTVKLNSSTPCQPFTMKSPGFYRVPKRNIALTSLSNQEEEPYAPRNIQQERYGVSRPTQHPYDREPYAQRLLFQP